MRKKRTPVFCYLIAISIWCIFILSSCQTSRLAQKSNRIQPDEVTVTSLTSVSATALQESQLLAHASTNQQEPAAAGTRPESDLFVHAPDIIDTPVARTVAKPAMQTTSATQGQTLHKKVSLPARMLMKRIAKKAEKLQKKDIKGVTQQKEINNKSYLILGIVLLAAGLVLVLVGSTTVLYILGSVASLAGLVFLLLAIL